MVVFLDSHPLVCAPASGAYNLKLQAHSQVVGESRKRSTECHLLRLWTQATPRYSAVGDIVQTPALPGLSWVISIKGSSQVEAAPFFLLQGPLKHLWGADNGLV